MLADLMNFNKFVAPTLIRIVYWIGIVLIILGALGGIVGGGAMMGGGGFSLGGALMALIGGVLALLVWRVICELWIVIFSINDRLGVLVEREKA